MSTKADEGGQSDLFQLPHSRSRKEILERSTSVQNELGNDFAQVSSPNLRKNKKLGTLFGVFLPCVQNIVGTILFLRLTWITGQAGTFNASIILLCCIGTTVVTTFSLSAIATNGKIPSGGPYYVISRNLGHGLGTAIGIIYYFALTAAAALYVLGAVEAFQTSFGLKNQFAYDMQIESVILAITLAGIVYVGVRYVNMASSAFLGVVFASVLSSLLGLVLLLSGSIEGALRPEELVALNNTSPSFEYDRETQMMPSFASLLALTYPAVTGFLAGTNRSGVLQNPSQSIPYGTLTAITFSTLIYLVFIWSFGCSIANQTLKADKLILSTVSYPFPMLVKIGILFSSIGAGLQSFVGAPRILAAIALDNSSIPLLGKFAISSPDAEPRLAVLLTCVLALFPCLAGNLDLISPLVTMCMLMMYMAVNLSCFVLAILKSPSFRPTWKWFHWSTAFLGVIWCFGLMVLISWYQALLASFFTAVIYLYISLQGASKDWGTPIQGLKYQIAMNSLLGLQERERVLDEAGRLHVKNWRPQVMVLCDVKADGTPQTMHLLEFAGQLKRGKGLLEAVGVISTTDGSEPRPTFATQRLQHKMDNAKIKGFGRVIYCSDVFEGRRLAIQCSGLGELRCNIILMEWLEHWRTRQTEAVEFVNLLHDCIHYEKSLMLLKDASTISLSRDEANPTIDIWWFLHDGGLLLLIPYLLHCNTRWKTCELRLFTIAEENENSIALKRTLEQYLERLRIRMKIKVVEVQVTDVTDLVSTRTIDMVAQRQLLAQLHLHPSLDASPSAPGPRRKQGLNQLFAQEATSLETSVLGTDEVLVEEKCTQPSHRVGNLSDIDLSRLEHAMRLRNRIAEHSGKARLVVMNLPRSTGMIPTDFLEYVEVLTEDLASVLLIRGAGQEVVTTVG